MLVFQGTVTSGDLADVFQQENEKQAEKPESATPNAGDNPNANPLGIDQDGNLMPGADRIVNLVKEVADFGTFY